MGSKTYVEYFFMLSFEGIDSDTLLKSFSCQNLKVFDSPGLTPAPESNVRDFRQGALRLYETLARKGQFLDEARLAVQKCENDMDEGVRRAALFLKIALS